VCRWFKRLLRLRIAMSSPRRRGIGFPNAYPGRPFAGPPKFLFGRGLVSVVGGRAQKPVRESQFEDRAQHQQVVVGQIRER
jgi:hypothetical protein